MTWLYGLLQGGGTADTAFSVDNRRREPSKSSNSTNKKPILKKRSMAQALLEGLHVAIVAPTQDKDKKARMAKLGSPRTNCYQFPTCPRQIKRENDGITAGSDGLYSSCERKCVRFSEQIEQRTIVGFE